MASLMTLKGTKWKNKFVFVDYEGNKTRICEKISDFRQIPRLEPGEKIVKLTALTIDLPIPKDCSPNILKQMLTHHFIEVETERHGFHKD